MNIYQILAMALSGNNEIVDKSNKDYLEYLKRTDISEITKK